jgi:selenocysteine lyase/cysteine desulfurase
VLDLQQDFSKFRAANPKRINLAAHSHHDWPDAAYDGHIACFNDAARLAGDKWSVVFTVVIPAVQAGIAHVLNLSEPADIAFAPNTHELIKRVLSCCPADRRLSVLATDAEFHSFRRQMARLEEDGLVGVEHICVEPFDTFTARFANAARRGGHDLVFFSQVFFSSGATAGKLDEIVDSVPERNTIIVIDGYHAFMAVPTDLSRIAGRAFYLAGGYKYAMAGEGACFMHCPPEYGLRPRDTGWFADFAALATPLAGPLVYPADGGRFLGATFDPSGLYRLRAVLEWLKARRISVADIHEHARALMSRFLSALDTAGIGDLSRQTLVTPFGSGVQHGNFLTFQTLRGKEIEQKRAAANVVADHRGDRLRFGFGICTRSDEIDIAIERIKAVVR